MKYENDTLPLPPENVDAAVCNGLFLYHDIKQFTRLKFIQLTSAGYDRVPIDYIRNSGIHIFNARGVYSIPMAEWALFRVLEYFKHGWNFKREQDNNHWAKDRTLRELSGCTVAIIGAGNVGQEVAKRFQAMGSYTIGFDIHTNKTAGFNSMTLIESLPDKVGLFDVIIITAPLLPSTKGIINRFILDRMKDDAIIVNIARGGIIKQEELIDILSKRKDIFAALDVFEDEPLDNNSKLWVMDNVAISPHNSFVGNGNNERMFNLIQSNLKDFVENKQNLLS